MSTIYFPYVEHTTGGDIVEGQEGDSLPDYEPTYVDRSYYGAAFLKPVGAQGPFRGWFDQVNAVEEYAVGDTVYLVDVQYQTGDTFGYTSGYHYLEGAYPTEGAAEDVALKILSGDYEGYKPWSGYFERLESVDVREFKIKEV